MITVCNRVSLQLFYAKNHTPPGYVRVTILNLGGEDGNRYIVPYLHSPLYLPLRYRNEKYVLDRKTVFWAEDDTPGNIDACKKRWKVHELKIPTQERERLGVIFDRTQESLETLLEQAISLAGRNPNSRRRFLSIFPTPLREGFEEKKCYGTIRNKQPIFQVYKKDLPSYREKATATPASRENRIPIRPPSFV